MISVRVVLMILALGCFMIAAAGVIWPRGVNFVAMGLFLWALSTLLAAHP
jgi:hypothetical protein